MDRIASSDTIGGVLDLARPAADVMVASHSCFARETKLLTKDGLQAH